MSNLYKCQNCKNIWISERSISTENRYFTCPRRRSQLLEKSRCNCQIELLTTGSYKTISGWAHSLMLGLDSSFQGP